MNDLTWRITLNKQELRKRMREKRNCLSQYEIITKSNKIFKKIEELDFFSEARDILIYVNYKTEVHTREFIKRCILLGKNVFVPKVYGKTMMHFIQLHHMEDLEKGTYGILEPIHDEPIWENQHLTANTSSKTLMILPALALDKQFNRVGYGGGYYDKYLSLHDGIIKIAVGFDFQLVNELKIIEEKDQKVDIIVTEQIVLLRGGNDGFDKQDWTESKRSVQTDGKTFYCCQE